jgi:hypothetical protein
MFAPKRKGMMGGWGKFIARYCWSSQVREGEMSEAYRTHGSGMHAEFS